MGVVLAAPERGDIVKPGVRTPGMERHTRVPGHLPRVPSPDGGDT